MLPRIRHSPQRAASARRAAILLASAIAAIAPVVRTASAQRGGRLPDALRGSKESVQKMYDFAQTHRLAFYLTPTNVNDAIAKGRLVPLTGDSTYELTRGVGFSYATREAKQFVLAFAPQYLAACGTPLTVTSAARPTSRQPHNANPLSVHPTGIAVDLRRPHAGPCLTWVREALAQLEEKGFVEATEERHPVHLHVAVLSEPGRTVVLPRLVSGSVPRAPVATPVSRPLASASPRGARTPAAAVNAVSSSSRTVTKRGEPARPRENDHTYRVREGDTLWDVARRTGVSVKALARANNRSTRSVLRPGVTLRLPATGSR